MLLAAFAAVGWGLALELGFLTLRFRRQRDAARRAALELPHAARDAVARWREKARAARERTDSLRHPHPPAA